MPSGDDHDERPASAPLSTAGTDRNSGKAELTRPHDVGRAKYRAVELDASQTGAGKRVGGVPDTFQAGPPTGGSDSDPTTVVGQRDPLHIIGGSDPGHTAAGEAL
jgi:hypothetical protein